MFAPVLALTLCTGGCLVTSSTFEAKTKEADSLRDALAAVNRQNNVLEARYAALQKELSDEKDAGAALSSRVREQEEELRRVKEDLSASVKKYEGTRITREELIAELLEKEKATGKRIQDLSARAQACEIEMEKLRREAEDRETALSELKTRVEETPDMETLRRERDILLGRVERLKEERRQEERRRDVRFSELAKSLAGMSPEIAAAPVGPALRVLAPDKVLFLKGTATLSEAGKKLVEEMGRTASEFPSAAVIISAGERAQVDEIRGILTNGHSLSPERILADAGGRTRETELILVVP